MPIADCHIHIFDAGSFPFPEGAAYRPAPEIGRREDMKTVYAVHGVTHALVVNAFRGSDHRQMIDVLAWGEGALKGIATLSPTASEAEMAALENVGVVGQRFDLADVDLPRLNTTEGQRFLGRLQERGWLAELQMNAKSSPEILRELLRILQRARLRLVIGHYSQPNPELPFDQPIFSEVLKLAEDGTTVVKLSSFFRHTRQGLPYADLDPFIETILGRFGVKRCAWGSDWPFTRFPGHVTYGEELACLERWIPDAMDRQAVLWDTPARVFRFDPAAGFPMS